ncbi:MAG: dockerin type I repeat-containing protein [candidate division Zixibacteria bacterium]|nr:dockerin type I repeat-containing protein [candidate division Zixibacteria bacterium]
MSLGPSFWRILTLGVVILAVTNVVATNRPDNPPSDPPSQVNRAESPGGRVTVKVPASIVWDTIFTQCGIGLVVDYYGNMGHNYLGGVNLNYSPFTSGGPECDTGGNSRGYASIYLGDASPVIIRKTAENSYVASWSIFENGFATGTRFEPLITSSERGSFSTPSYDGFNTGTMCTVDSLVKIEKTYFAPSGAPNADSCEFVVQRMRIFPFNIGQSVTNLAIGEAFDWDIPTDSGTSNNVGGFDASRGMVYMRGFNSTDAVADCYDNSLRYGGVALIKMHMKNCFSTRDLYAGFNAPNDSFVYPSGGFVPAEQWEQMIPSGYTTGARITDLYSMLIYKNQAATGWTLPADDTLTIWTALAVTRPSGGTTAQALDSLKKTIDKAVAWSWQVQENCRSCCIGTTGDVNGDGRVDVADLSQIIFGLIFPPPLVPCLAEANVNAVGAIDLSDLSLLIAYLTYNPRPSLPECPL